MGGGSILTGSVFRKRAASQRERSGRTRAFEQPRGGVWRALALAMSGDVPAQSLADDLDRRFPEDTVVRLSYLPVLRARLALNQGDAAEGYRTAAGASSL